MVLQSSGGSSSEKGNTRRGQVDARGNPLQVVVADGGQRHRLAEVDGRVHVWCPSGLAQFRFTTFQLLQQPLTGRGSLALIFEQEVTETTEKARAIRSLFSSC